ncbi:MAG: hypothetical protein H6883_11385 [Rhodobiaceae bacterium]|nr:hypothetical protein [Rhodobiaceae bacterium]
MNWQDRLTSEKSLLAVYRTARKVASARINAVLAWSIFVVMVLALAVNACFGMPVSPYGSLIIGIREVADAGFALTTAILGFLIAGFAIFASITKPGVFILLAKLDHKKGGISRLQFIFFNFLLVFVHFLTFLALCLTVKVTLYSNGPLSGALRWVAENQRLVIVVGASCMFAAMTAWLVFLLMLLKSFIWNLYQAVLVTITTEAQLTEQDAEGDK